MIDFSEVYHSMLNAKTSKDKYRYGMKVIEFYCEKGQITNATSTFSTSVAEHAKEIGITEKKMKEDLERLLKKGYANAVPPIISEIEKSLDQEGNKNFVYLENRIETAFSYAKESGEYSINQLLNLNERLVNLRNKLLNIKKDTPKEKIVDWRVVNLKDLNNSDTDRYY